MNYIRQLIYDMRHQKMMTWVSISGTAVSIFLVLVFFMVNNLSTVEVAPESNRHLIYGSPSFRIEIVSGEKTGWSINGTGINYAYAKKLFDNLEGVEAVSYTDSYPAEKSVVVDSKAPVMATIKIVDGEFWKMYDFKFIDGRPFSEDECLNNTHTPIVVTERLARRLFGGINAIDKELRVNGAKYYVMGVIENTSAIFKTSYGEAYAPLDVIARRPSNEDPEFEAAGNVSAKLKLYETTDPADVQKQIDSRMAVINAELDKIGSKASIGQLKTPAEMGSSQSWSRAKTVSDVAKRQYLVYALLLLLPAINLSSMMRGRLQDRISEIGVRRAYGARRKNIILQLLGENLIVTIVGALIGLLLSYFFMMFFSSSFIAMIDSWWVSSLDVKMSTPTFSMLFTWKAFAIAVGACLLLNILTASVPAWRASSIPPALAISKSKN